ncbi:MAG: DUF4124 domain-containing protein [Desulfobacteraceae bacterium]|nr:MAG: DUF4124 domain-containing protein [Desulfobacteraceae bacterium]
MQKICASILFYLLISCPPASVYADLYIWTDENGVKHFSNIAPKETDKSIRLEEEIIFDEAKYKEFLEQQKAYEEKQAAEKAVREEKDIKEREIEAINKLEKTIREEKEAREKEIEAAKELEEKIDKEERYQNYPSFTVVRPHKIGKSGVVFKNNPHIQKDRKDKPNATSENQNRKENAVEVKRVDKYKKGVDEYNKEQKQSQSVGLRVKKPDSGKDDPNGHLMEDIRRP